jgi:hypothetical protein
VAPNSKPLKLVTTLLTAKLDLALEKLTLRVEGFYKVLFLLISLPGSYGKGYPLKFHPGQPCPTLLRPAVGLPPKRPYGLTAVFGVARSQGERPAAVFYPLGYPTPYGPVLYVFIGYTAGDTLWVEAGVLRDSW